MQIRSLNFPPETLAASLSGKKSSVRVIMAKQPPSEDHRFLHCITGRSPQLFYAWGRTAVADDFSSSARFKSPLGDAGDRICMREKWRAIVKISAPWQPDEYGVAHYVPSERHCHSVEYAHQTSASPYNDRFWMNASTMPEFASRASFDVVSVRVERLQDATEESALREGFPEPCLESYVAYWRSKGLWEQNPYVWVYEIKLIAQ